MKNNELNWVSDGQSYLTNCYQLWNGFHNRNVGQWTQSEQEESYYQVCEGNRKGNVIGSRGYGVNFGTVSLGNEHFRKLKSRVRSLIQSNEWYCNQNLIGTYIGLTKSQNCESFWNEYLTCERSLYGFVVEIDSSEPVIGFGFTRDSHWVRLIRSEGSRIRGYIGSTGIHTCDWIPFVGIRFGCWINELGTKGLEENVEWEQ